MLRKYALLIMCPGITALIGIKSYHSKWRCDVIVDDIRIIMMVFDGMRYMNDDSAVNSIYGLLFENSMWPPNAVSGER